MTIKLSAEQINNDYVKKLIEISGQNIKSCYQCGNCSAGCPAVDFMDIPPHHIIRLAQLGLVDGIFKSNTIWVCASCITCTVRCPRGVDLSKIMEASRQIVLRSNFNYVDINKLHKSVLKDLPQLALIGNFRKFTI